MSSPRPRFTGALVAATLLSGCAHTAGNGLSPREQAQLELSRNHPEAAYPLLRELHRQSPTDLDVARLEVESAVKSGQVEALLAELSAPHPGEPAPVLHYMRGLALFAKAADASGQAIGEFQQSIALAPDVAEYHYRLGLALLESEHYPQALPPLEKAVELNPQRPGIYLPLAKAYARAGKRDAAVRALGAFVRQSPSANEVRTARMLMESIADPFAGFPQAVRPKLDEGINALQQYDAPQPAIVAFEEILHDYPDLAVVHALLGLAFQRLDDAGRAVDEFRRAIELDPESGKNQLYLGTLYASHQRAEQAAEAFTKAVALDPLLDEAYARLADIEFDRRDLPKAQEHLQILTALRPGDGAAQSKLAAVYQLNGNVPAAEHVLKTVLDKDPDNQEALLHYGMLEADVWLKATSAEQKARARETSVKQLSHLLELQPDNALASQTLAKLKAQ